MTYDILFIFIIKASQFMSYFFLFNIILCMTALLCLSNCAKDEEVMTGTIAGLVSDMTNANTAIAGATVTLSPTGLSKTTGSDGRYEFTAGAIDSDVLE